MNKIRRNLQQSSLINKIIDNLINNYLCYVKLYLHMLQLNSYITVKVNDIRAWQSSWNPVKPSETQTTCVTKVEQAGGWVKGASVEKTRETSGSWATRHCTPVVLLFCLRGFCSVHESNDHSLPSPTRQFQPARWESASPLVPFHEFPPLFLPILFLASVTSGWADIF